jgi:hypothetical protein
MGKSCDNINQLCFRCGICGDAYDVESRQHSASGGLYANGIITRGYTLAQKISVTAHLTANHLVS